MPDETTGTPPKPVFTEKDNRLLAAAMMSLKSGFPDIDMAKFQKNGDFNTLKTASNTWGTLKKKLKDLSPTTEDDNTPDSPKGKKQSPKKEKTTPASKKRAVARADEDDEDSPTKKAKATRKKAAGKKGNEDNENGNGTGGSGEDADGVRMKEEDDEFLN